MYSGLLCDLMVGKRKVVGRTKMMRWRSSLVDGRKWIKGKGDCFGIHTKEVRWWEKNEE